MAEKAIKCDFTQLAVGGLYDVHVPMGAFTRISRCTLLSISEEGKARVATFDNGVKVIEGVYGLWFERIHLI